MQQSLLYETVIRPNEQRTALQDITVQQCTENQLDTRDET